MKKSKAGMDWDQLRYFLELSRCKTLAAAAARLQVNPTTVARRIQSLEHTLATALFTRTNGVHSLTDTGRRLIPHAEQAETSLLAVERDARGKAAQVSGLVRIGCTEGFGIRILMPLVVDLARANPHLRIDLLAVPRIVNLSRREADIAITLERPGRGPYLTTKLTEYALGLYGSRAYLARHAPIRSKSSLERHTFVSYIDDLVISKELQYLSDVCRPDQITLRSTSLIAQQQAVRAGAGLAILPKFLARDDKQLVPVLPDEVGLTRTFWMSMPTEIKDLSRMQVTWRFIKEAVAADTKWLSGLERNGSSTARYGP